MSPEENGLPVISIELNPRLSLNDGTLSTTRLLQATWECPQEHWDGGYKIGTSGDQQHCFRGAATVMTLGEGNFPHLLPALDTLFAGVLCTRPCWTRNFFNTGLLTSRTPSTGPGPHHC